MSRYKATTIIEDENGNEICRQGDSVTIKDSVGTTISGVMDKIDWDDGNKVIFFDGWNVKVVLDYIDKIEKHDKSEAEIEIRNDYNKLLRTLKIKED